MRIATLGIIAGLLGCTACAPSGAAPPRADALPTGATASPYIRVVRGPVSALVPRTWRTVRAPAADGIRGGFFASPHPNAWSKMDGSVAGLAATWVDATKVGVPSDFYYFAATGPLLDLLQHGRRCRAVHRVVFADHRPGFDGLRGPSPGDYVARASGRCSGSGGGTRWASFVAAPGFGPADRVGIPGSGLYVVVAVVRDSTGAGPELRQLVGSAAFGGTTVPQLVGAVTGRVPVPS